MAGTPLTGYQRRLFLFLSVATFFEGYDFIALTQILPNLRADMGLSAAAGGWLVAFINLGTVFAYLLIRKADRWGRRRVLTITIAGYTLFTFLSGLAPGVLSFAAFQFVARMFLITEWAVSMVYAAEEFPADRRGMVIGVISGFASVGSIVCAGLVPIMIQSQWGWRTVYFAGIIPLLLLAFARRGLKESRRYAEQAGDRASTRQSFLLVFRTEYRRRMLQLALIWSLTYLCFHTAITFWKEFAVAERGLSDGQVAQAITVAALVAIPLVFGVGPLLDRIGRRRGAIIVFLLGTIGIFFCYTLHGQWALTLPLTLGIAAASAVTTVLNAFTTELFPTHLRADAFAWSNNLLGRFGYVMAPIVIGMAAQDFGWGAAVRLTTISPIIALALILYWLPETRARELEETAIV